MDANKKDRILPCLCNFTNLKHFFSSISEEDLQGYVFSEHKLLDCFSDDLSTTPSTSLRSIELGDSVSLLASGGQASLVEPSNNSTHSSSLFKCPPPLTAHESWTIRTHIFNDTGNLLHARSGQLPLWTSLADRSTSWTFQQINTK